MKKILYGLLLVFVLSACSTESEIITIEEDITENIVDIDEEIEETMDETEVDFLLEGEEIVLDEYYDNKINDHDLLETSSITESGTYILEGDYTETITIDVDDEDVTLILNDANLTSSEGPAINVVSADTVTITSLVGTVNTIEDSSVYPVDAEYSAAIYSAGNLTFNGTGTLVVTGNYNDAIQSKDHIKIIETNIEVYSVDDGIIGKDYIAIANATITTDTVGDSLKATDTDEGYIFIESGTLNITSGADGIQGYLSVLITGGDITINAEDEGIQADGTVTISGGTIEINSNDDAINTVTLLEFNGGFLTINAVDDGMHSDEYLVINDGTIDIQSSYEGIEGFNIEINGGVIDVVASDDAINATTGGGQIHGPDYVSTGGFLTINGGLITVDAVADGIDVNGSALMTGGYVIVNGPTSAMQSPIDYDEAFNITGGTIISLGSTGMMYSLSDTSDQYSVNYRSTTTYSAGTVVTLSDDSGVIIEYTATKSFGGITISTPELSTDTTYELTIDSTVVEFEITSIVTDLGNVEAFSEDNFGSSPGGEHQKPRG